MMRVSYATSLHGKDEVNAVVSVLKGNTALGEKTIAFEKSIAKLFGKKFGVMVNSGSSANLLALELLNLPKGSEIITPVLTFATTVAPILQKGLKPIFVDVEPGTYLMNTRLIEKRITKNTRAIMAPSLIGNVPDLKYLRGIAKRHNLWLIEDSCDTLGATYAGNPTGMYSDISTTSFYGSHIINGAGGGGMILVNNPEWAKRLIILRGWGRMSSLFGETGESEDIKKRFRARLGNVPYDAKFVFSEIGYNFLPLEISAAFALAQLRKLPQFIKTRQKNFKRLEEFFRRYEKFFLLPRETSLIRTAWLAFPLTIKEGAPFSRKDICMFLERHNIQTRPIFTGNILCQPAFRNIRRGISSGDYPVSNHVMSHAFLIGCHQGLTSAHIQYMQDIFKKFFKALSIL